MAFSQRWYAAAEEDCSFRAIVEKAGAPFHLLLSETTRGSGGQRVAVRAIRTDNNNSYVGP